MVKKKSFQTIPIRLILFEKLFPTHYLHLYSKLLVKALSWPGKNHIMELSGAKAFKQILITLGLIREGSRSIEPCKPLYDLLSDPLFMNCNGWAPIKPLICQLVFYHEM